MSGSGIARGPRPTVPIKGLLAGLFLLSLLPFLGALDHGFVNYDDYTYVTENPQVHAGLTRDSVHWAFTTRHFSNWHPITWLSYQLDHELFGLHARGYHLVSLLLHAINACLLFLVLRRLTGATRRSAAVALLWAVHPLRVESVVWISERKDLLSLAFGLLAISAYARYAREAKPRWMGVVALAMAFSLMSKPMLVTLPALLLLLDRWPLERWQGWLPPPRLVVEKWPLWGLALASAWVTIQAQTDAMVGAAEHPLSARLANAVVSIAEYLRDHCLPTDLAAFYPLDPRTTELSQWLPALGLTILLTSIAIARSRKSPVLLVGWSWFLVALAPVIGVLQVGAQARADRYTYIPSIGLWLAVVFVTWKVLESSLRPKAAQGAALALVVVCLLFEIFATQRQTATWHDSVTLFERALSVSQDHYSIRLNLGRGYAEQGRYGEAIPHYQRAITLDSGRVDAYSNLATALRRSGRPIEALDAFDRALAVDPFAPQVLVNRAGLLDDLGRPDAALEDLAVALAVAPNLARARQGFAALLPRVTPSQARRALHAGLDLDPNQELLRRTLAQLDALADRPTD